MKSFLLLFLILIPSLALADTTVCSSLNVFYKQWTRAGGPVPRPGDIMAKSTLIFDDKVVESRVDLYEGPVPLVPDFHLAFDAASKQVLKSVGNPTVGYEIYQIDLAITQSSNPALHMQESMVCRRDWALIP